MSEKPAPPPDFIPLIDLAKKATSPGPEKWQSNTELLTWFRADPEAVCLALQAAHEASLFPGGINRQRLQQALLRVRKAP